MMLKISIDIDGVVLNFNRHFQEYASKLTNTPIEQLSDAYNLNNRFGLCSELSKTIWTRFIGDGMYSSIPPYPDVKKWFDELKQSGHSFAFKTAISDSLETERRVSLQPLELHDELIYFTGDHGAGHTKHEAIKEYMPDVFIDDQLLNLKHAKELGVPHLIWVDNNDTQLQEPSSDSDIKAQWQDIATQRVTALTDISIPKLINLEVEKYQEQETETRVTPTR